MSRVNEWIGKHPFLAIVGAGILGLVVYLWYKSGSQANAATTAATTAAANGTAGSLTSSTPTGGWQTTAPGYSNAYAMSISEIIADEEANGSGISSLGTSVGGLTSSVGGLTSSVGTLTSDVGGLSTQITSLDTSLASQLAGISTQLAGVSSQETGLGNQLSFIGGVISQGLASFGGSSGTAAQAVADLTAAGYSSSNAAGVISIIQTAYYTQATTVSAITTNLASGGATPSQVEGELQQFITENNASIAALQPYASSSGVIAGTISSLQSSNAWATSVNTQIANTGTLSGVTS